MFARSCTTTLELPEGASRAGSGSSFNPCKFAGRDQRRRAESSSPNLPPFPPDRSGRSAADDY
jgi:hypothetical protein